MKNDKNKGLQKSGKKETSIVRSSAAEYLTFVAAGGSSETSVEMRYEDENVWMTQKMMAVLYDVSIPAINQHLKRIFADNERTRTNGVLSQDIRCKPAPSGPWRRGVNKKGARRLAGLRRRSWRLASRVDSAESLGPWLWQWCPDYSVGETCRLHSPRHRQPPAIPG